MISRSRWKWTVALGSPVVPEVNPSSATSSLPVVAASNEHPVARFDAEVLREGVSQPVAPVRQLLVRAPSSVADERHMVAEPLLDHAVGQFNGDVDVLRILKLRPVEQQIGPLVGRRQMISRKGVHVRARAQRRSADHRHSFPETKSLITKHTKDTKTRNK